MNYFHTFTQKLSNLNGNRNYNRNSIIVTSIGASLTSIFLYKIYSTRGTNSQNVTIIDSACHFFYNVFVSSLSQLKKITYTYSRFNKINKEDGPDKHLIQYEYTYYKMFSQMDDEELDEDYVKSLKNNIIYEMTPRGRVALYYDSEKETFNYYCDTKDIPYKYLEAVAHKYAITYDCKKIVVDMKKELEKSLHHSNMKQQKMTSVLKSPSSKDDVNIIEKTTDEKKRVSIDSNMYVSYKQYNRKGSGGNTVPNKKIFVTKNNSNRYSYLGKMNEFSFLQTDKYKSKEVVNEVFDYAAFKKLTGKK